VSERARGTCRGGRVCFVCLFKVHPPHIFVSWGGGAEPKTTSPSYSYVLLNHSELLLKVTIRKSPHLSLQYHVLRKGFTTISTAVA